MHLKWDKRLELGITFMDQEHKEILETIAKLLTSIDFANPNQDDVKSFEAFEDLVIAHFYHEELLMRQYKYPAFDTHIEAHKKILQRIDRFKEKYCKMGLNKTDLERIHSEVKYLFKMHLLEEDRDLEGFVHELLRSMQTPK